VACGPGVERLAEEVQARFPSARKVVLSSDLHGGLERLRHELAAIAAGEVDVIIGTQLVAKGHNFPKLTLVGVIDADLGFARADLRAAERTFQVLSQVTGRAGRGGGKSRALLQTHAPDNPVLASLAGGDREAFYQAEIADRRAARLPPFARLAAIIVSSPNRGDAAAYAAAFRRSAPAEPAISLFGPSEAALPLIRGHHRYRLLAEAAKGSDLQNWLRHCLTAAPRPRASTRVQIDIDPQSFL
jgi:primosomal protein N' (replication factor Y)